MYKHFGLTKQMVVNVLILLSVALNLSCCGKNVSHDEIEKTSGVNISETLQTDYIVNGTVFEYENVNYNLTEREPAINAITDCIEVGKYIVIEGHVNPKHSAYCVFNTETQVFEKDIVGANLVWYGDDITTAVYSFWNEIYDYEGNIIAVCELNESDYIYSIDFIEENTKIQVEIMTISEPYTMIFDLKEGRQ